MQRHAPAKPSMAASILQPQPVGLRRAQYLKGAGAQITHPIDLRWRETLLFTPATVERLFQYALLADPQRPTCDFMLQIDANQDFRALPIETLKIINVYYWLYSNK